MITKDLTQVCACSVATLVLMHVAGCDSKAPAPATTGSTGTPAHQHAPGGTHGGGHSHGGVAIPLGEQTIGAFRVVLTRDEGAIVPGKDIAIDAVVTPTGAAKTAAVRFWVGTQDAAGSVKAKADIEDPKSPTQWHTHAEIPNPLPAESRIWVEVEDATGTKAAGGFELK